MHDSRGAVNRLARESSPYLRLHARNPVDWYPWGAEAIERARREDRPIFLSAGYSTCYWCHVMERESFSDPVVAAEMNRHFVNVKVDREERPDLDEIYMLATQILTGHGGWPNSVFLTPRLEPFFAGTYFPPVDRQGMPSFRTVLESMVHAWTERRADVEEQAGELAAAIRHHLEEIEPFAGEIPGGDLAVRALDGLRKRFDPTWGGFGEAPKFPTPSNLWLLAAFAPERADAAMMLVATLDGMARGGLFDQLGGGFHRYSTDREWRVPHFEKMLYDNGLLLEIYAREHARTGSPEARRVALATAEFLLRELASPEGAFWSAIDAETDGREGAFYVWSRREIEAAVGEEDATFLAPLMGFADEPFFEDDTWVLHLPRPLEVAARERRTTREALLAEIEPLRAKLLEARGRRKRPATDDKILVDWNGTAIAGLAVAGHRLGRPDLVERAARAAEFLLATLRGPQGTLLHAWRAGEGRTEGFLADYVLLVRSLLRLHEATKERRWLDEALRLQDEQEARLASPRGGYFNAAGSEDLLARGKEIFDGALPAANGVAALNLLELAAAAGEERFRAAAERTLRAFAPLVTTHPDGARTMTLAFRAHAGPAPGGPATGGGTAQAAGQDQGLADREQDRDEGRDEMLSVEREDGDRSGVAAADVASHRVAPAGAGAGGETPRTGAFPSTDRLSSSSLSLRAVAAAAASFEGRADADGFRALVLRVVLAGGWHLAAEPEPPVLVGVGGEVRGIEMPPPRVVEKMPGGPALRGWIGSLEIRGRFRPDSPRPALALTFSACGEGACHPAATLETPLS